MKFPSLSVLGLSACLVHSVLLAGLVRAGEPTYPITLEIAAEHAQPAVQLSGHPLALEGAGGFRVIDAATRADITLPAGQVAKSGPAFEFTAASPELRLHATFTVVAGRVDVHGEIENLRGGDRGVVLEYRVPRWSSGLRFASALDETRPMNGKYEENAYPLAATGDANSALALAIPPSQPCVFGLAGDADGLVLRFYLGLTPATRAFPNRAPFAFVLYGVDPREPFRSALSQYYALYPDYYTRRLKSDGLWMFQMGDRVPPNIDQYGFDEIEPAAKTLAAAIERDVKHGIPMFPYTIVGQREIKHLPELPRSYAEAVKVLEAWQPPAKRTISKEDVSPEMAARLKDEIESSACMTSDGRYALVIRNTTWGKNSVTFKANPNPALFADQGRASVGGDVLTLVKEWLTAHPEFSGVYVDSLGANWPATLNYRKDHFPYARFPLTVDTQGRVALHNDLSHYEFLDALRTLLRSSNRYLFGNGIYGYRSRGERAGKVEVQSFDNQLHEFTAQAAPAEHYRAGARVGRFFDAALLDVGGSEAGVHADVARCQDARIFMGQKPYAFLNYDWEEGAKVEELVNKSLSYAIFATSSKNFMNGVEYEQNPDGYLRDRKLIDWFVPLARTLSRAGWQPVRHAEVSGRKLVCERYGEGQVVYYSLYNDLAKAQSATVQLDAVGLGFRAGGLQIEEIGRGTALQRQGDAVTLELQPKKTYVLKVTATRR